MVCSAPGKMFFPLWMLHVGTIVLLSSNPTAPEALLVDSSSALCLVWTCEQATVMVPNMATSTGLLSLILLLPLKMCKKVLVCCPSFCCCRYKCATSTSLLSLILLLLLKMCNIHWFVVPHSVVAAKDVRFVVLDSVVAAKDVQHPLVCCPSFCCCR